jgi:hypothetical protein
LLLFIIIEPSISNNIEETAQKVKNVLDDAIRKNTIKNKNTITKNKKSKFDDYSSDSDNSNSSSSEDSKPFCKSSPNDDNSSIDSTKSINFKTKKKNQTPLPEQKSNENYIKPVILEEQYKTYHDRYASIPNYDGVEFPTVENMKHSNTNPMAAQLLLHNSSGHGINFYVSEVHLLNAEEQLWANTKLASTDPIYDEQTCPKVYEKLVKFLDSLYVTLDIKKECCDGYFKKMNPENIFSPCVVCGKLEYTTQLELKDCIFNLRAPETLELIQILKVDFEEEPWDWKKIELLKETNLFLYKLHYFKDKPEFAAFNVYKINQNYYHLMTDSIEQVIDETSPLHGFICFHCQKCLRHKNLPAYCLKKGYDFGNPKNIKGLESKLSYLEQIVSNPAQPFASVIKLIPTNTTSTNTTSKTKYIKKKNQ